MVANVLDSLKNLGLPTVQKTQKKDQSLQQSQFLKLMTTQLTHQDPSKPMDNGAFLTQMAQFSTVSGIQDLQKSFKDFAGSISSGQALQASALVGKSVSAPSTEGLLAAGGSIEGQVTLPSSSPDVNLKIIDPSTGEVVRNIDMGIQSAGNMAFKWDGMTANNEFANPGVYKIQVEATIDGKNTQLATQIHSKVESVTLGKGSQGLKINLAGLGSVNFNQIKQIL